MDYKVGIITKKIIKTLSLGYKEEVPIYVGKSNLKHMKEQHPKDFSMYGKYIKDIIKNPTYLAKNDKKNSIEFIKKYNKDFVLVAVRMSKNKINFARTMYVMADEKVEKYYKNKYFHVF